MTNHRIYYKKFFILFALLLCGRFLDLATTYLASPNLLKENNPIVLIFNLDWEGVFIWQVLVISLLIACIWYTLRFQSGLEPSKEGEKRMDSISAFILGQRSHWTAHLFALPDSRELVFYAIVYLVSRMAIISGFVVALWNSLVFMMGRDAAKYKFIHDIWLILTIVLVFYLFYKEHRELYKRKTNSHKKA